jgi:alkanesulfonate monooxygenase SsuD/methylene tetrahydromethanopterin reductase-like flavin-dependent oxidoreductase (luciferase family)
MKFGIFYELQLPRPWQAGDELKLYQDALTQLEPPTGLATTMPGWWNIISWKNIRIRRRRNPFSPPPASAPRKHPARPRHFPAHHQSSRARRRARRGARSAQQRPREFGMGESASITELTPFGRDMETKKEVFEEAVRAIFPMFKEGGSEHHGKYFDIPLRNVVPKPVQKPHPPLWMACSQLPTIERAGQNGFGALGFQFVSADAAHAWVHAYYNAITKRLKKLADYEINPNMALVSFFMCAKTDEEARARADGATFFQFALRYYGASQNRQRPAPGTVNMWDEYNKWKRENPEAQEAALRGGLIGSPETIRKKLRRFRTSHIDQVILLNQAGKNSHEHICESLELFAKEVMPEFQNDPEHEAWKKGVMSGAIQLEEIDTEAFKDRYGKLAVSNSVNAAASGHHHVAGAAQHHGARVRQRRGQRLAGLCGRHHVAFAENEGGGHRDLRGGASAF